MSLREMTVCWIDQVLNDVWGEDVSQVPGQDVWWIPGTMPRRFEVEGREDVVTVEVSAAARLGVEPTAEILQALHDQQLSHLLGEAVLHGDIAAARVRMHAHDASRPALQRALDVATTMSAAICAALEDLPGGGECGEREWHPPHLVDGIDVDELGLRELR